MEFKDKITLITGSGAGIGRATALAFAAAGSTVCVSDIDVAGGEETVRLITEKDGNAFFVKADVTDFAQVENLLKTIIERYGKLDIAVNNAGINAPTARTADTPLSSWDKVMLVNATSVFYCLKVETAQMLKQGGGIIVNVASVAGLQGLPNNLPYAASKHAVVGMTRTASIEYARKGIRINAICPGFSVTALFNPEEIDEISAGLSDKLKAAIPMKRFGTPAEQADAILWLCSEKASFVTGHCLSVDGGLQA